MIRLVPRTDTPALLQGSTPVLAVLATMLAGGLLFAIMGYDPVTAIRTIFWDPLFGPAASYSRPQLLVKAAPLILIASGLAVGFRAGIWNIGAEGQYIIGAICGAAVALAAYPAPEMWIFPAMVIAGAAGGWAWGMIPALLRNWFGASEILVSLMLVYVAQRIAAWMAFGPMKNPEGFGMPGSRNLQQYPAAANPELIVGTGAHWGVVAAVLAVLATWFLMSRHIRGFHIRAAGTAPRAARFAGVKPETLVAFCLGLSGALAGMAGLFEVAGPAGQITDKIGVGYGFTAIIVAFLGRLHPLGILLAGLLLALTYIGGELAQLTLNLPGATVQVFQGMLLFFLLGFDLLTRYRITRRIAA
ncbi:beta-methylgalactoside transporter inner membrane component [Paracoccus haematequi]|uniref:Beta-methylgalactoside transporter inner membrane component n=1 Tax=Paracoccus haematequi TaxID=2491866 RepID=A0A447IJL7_9RHOB|nr:ABC transporter permease [Paracoccus haematequi]VDS07654.1 beta-methylgalactoside transporter inner membrane component [Paracoccus haematequi]